MENGAFEKIDSRIAQLNERLRDFSDRQAPSLLPEHDLVCLKQAMLRVLVSLILAREEMERDKSPGRNGATLH